jgi:hypothetical protein
MIGLTLHRTLEGHIAGSGLNHVGRRGTGAPTTEGKIKAPPSAGRM